MGTTFLFIHGTGVREPAFSESFRLIQKGLTAQFGASEIRVEPCYWGEAVGSRLHLGGASIPNFDATKAVEDMPPPEADYPVALWNGLYQNPTAELEILAMRVPGKANLPPGQEPPGQELDDCVRDLTPQGDLSDLLSDAQITPFFDAARKSIRTSGAYHDAIVVGASAPLGEYRAAVGRALVAECLRRYRQNAAGNSGDAPLLPLDSATRDRIVDLLTDALGGSDRAVWDWVKQKAGRLLSQWATGYGGDRRGRISGAIAGGAMDILRYQAVPTPFREFVRRSISETSDAAKAQGQSGEVVVIAHSLGGIIVVEALIEQALPAVRQLITVGSQTGLLFENGALGSVPFDPKTPPSGRLPAHFPKWLNLYDDRDFLSYLTVPLFGADKARDVKVDNRQPFPEAHSAYWTNPQVWDAVAAALGSL